MKEKLELVSELALGDICTMTAGVRDLYAACKDEYEIKVATTYEHVWDHNPYLSNFDEADHVLNVGTGIGTQQSNKSGLHICNAYRICIEKKLNDIRAAQGKVPVSIPQGAIRPDLYLSEEEKQETPEIAGRYWVICIGSVPKFTSKLWPYDRWQEVVNELPWLTFVQVGLERDYHPRLQGRNVIDMVGRTEDPVSGIRRLFKLVYHADGCLSLVSALMHIAAGFKKPGVVVAGAREPASFINYYNWHRFLHVQGAMKCLANRERNEKEKTHVNPVTACWRSAIGACPNKVKSVFDGEEAYFAKCACMITVQDVINSILSYYEGGMLDRVTVDKSEQPIVLRIMERTLERRRRDMRLSLSISTEESVVAESETENNKHLVQDAMNAESQAEIKRLEAEYEEKRKNDPEQKGEPEDSVSKEEFEQLLKEEMEKKLENADTKQKQQEIIQGDNVRKQDSKLIEQLREPVRKAIPEFPKVLTLDDAKKQGAKPKVFKVIANAHGWGGGERSVAWLLNGMAERGWECALVPAKPGIINRQLSDAITHEVQITNALTAPCDVLLYYANDNVYDFDSKRYVDIMPKLQARRKIMVLNYRLGKVGHFGWTKGWDKYVFLSTQLRDALLKKWDTFRERCLVLPPPVDLSPFFAIQRDDPDDAPLHLLYLCSQASQKIPKNITGLMAAIRRIDPDARFSFMGSVDWIPEGEGIYKFAENEISPIEFLKRGNIFWYPLPEDYTDQGPRVVMEAMAAGLPVVTTLRHGGADDRLCVFLDYQATSSREYALKMETFRQDAGKRRTVGVAMRTWARRNFDPNKWLDMIEGIATD